MSFLHPLSSYQSTQLYDSKLPGTVEQYCLSASCFLPVEGLEAEVALVHPLPVGPHMSQQHKTPGELLVAGRALSKPDLVLINNLMTSIQTRDAAQRYHQEI